MSRFDSPDMNDPATRRAFERIREHEELQDDDALAMRREELELAAMTPQERERYEAERELDARESLSLRMRELQQDNPEVRIDIIEDAPFTGEPDDDDAPTEAEREANARARCRRFAQRQSEAVSNEYTRARGRQQAAPSQGGESLIETGEF